MTLTDPTRELALGGSGPLLETRGVDVAYGQVQILFGVDFQVHPGEIVALLGTNGAGKSTLLKAICGLVKPKRGTVHFAGEDITSLPADVTTLATMLLRCHSCLKASTGTREITNWRPVRSRATCWAIRSCSSPPSSAATCSRWGSAPTCRATSSGSWWRTSCASSCWWAWWAA